MDRDYNPQACGARCTQCPFQGRTPIAPEANPNARMILLGESPGREEVYFGKPFQGPTGRRVDALLKELNIPRSDLHLTVTMACAPKESDSEDDLKLATYCCQPRLEAELKGCSAEYVFSCGKMSLLTMNDSSHQDHSSGMFHDNGLAGKSFLQAWHPTMVMFHNPALQPVFKVFLERCWKTAIGELPRWQWPFLKTHFDNESIEMLRKIQASDAPVSFDCETIPSKDIITCVGLSNGEHTVTIPWDTYETVKWGQVAGLDCFNGLGREARELVAKILKSHVVITQNGAYDVYEMRKKGLEFVNGFDIMLAHAVLWPQLRHGLEWIAIQYFHVVRWKTEFKAYSDEKGSDKWQEADPQVLRIYNARDAFMQWMLYQPLNEALKTFPNGEWLYQTYMQDAVTAAHASEIGIQVDKDRLNAHRTAINELMNGPLTALKTQASDLGFKEFNPNSGKQLNAFFFNTLKCKPTRYSEKNRKASTRRQDTYGNLAVQCRKYFI